MNIFSCEGRIGRLQYFLWMLAIGLLAVNVGAVFEGFNPDYALIAGVVFLFFGIFLVVKRLHGYVPLSHSRACLWGCKPWCY